MYATLIRNAGWTMQQCWDQPAADVFSLLEQLRLRPPCYEIMAAVHLAPNIKPSAKEMNTESRKELAGLLGGARRLPPEMQELIDFALA